MNKKGIKTTNGIFICDDLVAMTPEELDVIRANEEFRDFAIFHDKLDKKTKLRDSNRRLLEHIKSSMDKVHLRLEELKKRQNEKFKIGRPRMAKTMPTIKKK